MVLLQTKHFFATLVHLWKQKGDVCEFLVKTEFASNETFFLLHWYIMETKAGLWE
jgi:hypothetical protein